MKPGTRLGPRPRVEKPTRPRLERVEPFTPWQIMVDDRMKELSLSMREVAKGLATPKRSINHTTVWAWTKCKEGSPPPATYTEEINRRLAKVLQIKPEVLAQAYEDSRRHLIAADPSAASRGPLSILRRLIADGKQDTYSRAELVKLIDDLQGR